MKRPPILLVEDNPGDVVLTERALRKNNILNEIVVASDGQEALDYLFGEGNYAGRGTSECPALVLLDIKLPRLDGHEVLRRMREDERTKLIPVVMLSSSREEEDVFESYRLGANSYIRKPVDFTKFVEAIKLVGCYWLVLNEPPPAPTGK